jgi:hypothetical protein
MAAELMKIEIQAQVQKALAALKNIQVELGKTEDATKKVGAAMPKLGAGTGQATQALTNLGRVAQDAPFGLIGIANNIDPLIQSFVYLKKETGSAAGAFQALGASLLGGGGVVLAVSLLTSALQFAVVGFDRWSQSSKQAKKDTKEFSDELASIGNNLSKEYQKVTQLVTLLETQNLSRGKQKAAIQELNKIAPEYFGNLEKEKGFVDKLSAAYFLYTNAIINVFRAKAREKELSKISDELLNVEEQIIRIEKIAKETGTQKGRVTIVDEKGRVQDIVSLYRTRGELQNKFKDLTVEINGLTAKELDISKDKKTKIEKETTALKDQLTGRIRLNEASAEDLRLLTNAGIVLDDLQQKYDLLNKGGKVGSNIDQPQNIRDLSLRGNRVLQPEALDSLQNIEKINETAKQLSDTINNGINGGIDTFFNALANNQDPFKALAQSVQRLVVELGAAVVKMIILKALANAIAPGVGGAAVDLGGKAFSGLGGLFKVRGNDMGLSLLRTMGG